jgi:hypothetical protein
MQRVLRLSVLAVLAGAILLAVPGSGGAALQPNDSVFFFKPGLGVTGTIHNGVFTQNPTAITVNMSGWTAATASRDTLLLLNGSTRQLQLGTFVAGTYTPVTSSVPIILDKRFTKMTASCDTFLAYSPSTGKLGTAKVSAGSIDLANVHVGTVAKNFTSVNSSCNTVTFLNNQGAGIIGTLKGGIFTKKGTIKTGIANPMVAHTATSFIRYSTSGHNIEWGTSNNGVEHVTEGPLPEIGTLSRLAGTASSVVFYNATTGQGTTDELVNGQLSNAHPQSFSAGWQIIVGGR